MALADRSGEPITKDEPRHGDTVVPLTLDLRHRDHRGALASTATTDSYTCLIGDLAKLTVNYTGLYAADQGALDAGRRGVVSASSIHRVLPGATVVYACSASGTGPLVQRLPITFSYRKVSDPTTKVGTPFTPRAVVRHKLIAR